MATKKKSMATKKKQHKTVMCDGCNRLFPEGVMRQAILTGALYCPKCIKRKGFKV